MIDVCVIHMLQTLDTLGPNDNLQSLKTPHPVITQLVLLMAAASKLAVERAGTG